MKLEDQIKQYRNLKKLEKSLQKQLKEMRDDIITHLHSKGISQWEHEGLKVAIQHKRKVTYNEPALLDILEKKDLLAWCTKLAVDEDAVAQCYWDRTLTDDDLRNVVEEQEIIALKVDL